MTKRNDSSNKRLPYPEKGTILCIDLKNGQVAYACVLEEPLVAFFEADSHLFDENPKNLERAPVAFAIWVMRSAVTSGKWPAVGCLDHTQINLRRPVQFFAQDAITGSLSIASESGVENGRSASFEECANLERAAVWSLEHVEDRLRDHFSGENNVWVEKLRATRGNGDL